MMHFNTCDNFGSASFEIISSTLTQIVLFYIARLAMPTSADDHLISGNDSSLAAGILLHS